MTAPLIAPLIPRCLSGRPGARQDGHGPPPARRRQREVADQGTRPGTSQAQSVARGATVMARTLPAELGVPAMSKYAFPAPVLSGLAAS